MTRRNAILLAALALAGCEDPDRANKAALLIGAPRPDAPAIRERQTETFRGVSEQRLLVEATQVLQDLGFTVEESAPRYGVLAGSKDRDATETQQVVGQMALAIGFALLGVSYNPVWDRDQIIRTTITTNPAGPNAVTMRVSFERIITTNQGTSRAEELTQAEFSRGFFEEIRKGLARGNA